eukprot:TCONS_00072772-protein
MLWKGSTVRNENFARKNKIHNMESKEIYQYKDIVLREKPLTAFKPNLKIVQNIRRIENELRRQQTQYDDKTQWIRNVVQLRTHQRQRIRNLTNNYRHHTKTDFTPIRKKHDNDVYCRILGQAYCRECNLKVKIEERKQQTKNFLENNIETADKPLTSKEKAVLAILPTTTVDKQPGLEYTQKYNEDLNQYRLIPLLSSDEPLKKTFKKAAHTVQNGRIINIVKKTDSEKKSEKSKSETTTNNNKDTKNLVKETATPPNSLQTPPPTRATSTISQQEKPPIRSGDSSSFKPRTDLEWFHDISKRRKSNVVQDRRLPDYFDVIQLAEKLSSLFRERHLPPERSFSRISNVSSVDLDPNDLGRIPMDRGTLKSRAVTRQSSAISLKPVLETSESSMNQTSNIPFDGEQVNSELKAETNGDSGTQGVDCNSRNELNSRSSEVSENYSDSHIGDNLRDELEDIRSLLNLGGGDSDVEDERDVGRKFSDDEFSSDEDENYGGRLLPIIPPTVNMTAFRNIYKEYNDY